MARGRMISKDISLDEKVNALSDDSARLLFTWIIPHLDVEGRIYGEPQVIKSIVAPRLNWATKRIEKYLTEFVSCGLFIRYSLNGNTYIFAPNFEKHQSGLRKDRESQSKIPPPPPELLQSNDGITPAQDKFKSKSKFKYKYKDKDKERTPKKPVKNNYGQFNNVLLTSDEKQKLIDKFGEDGFNTKVEELSIGIESKGYKYKSHYAAILSWDRMRDKNGAHRQSIGKLPSHYTRPEELLQ